MSTTQVSLPLVFNTNRSFSVLVWMLLTSPFVLAGALGYVAVSDPSFGVPLELIGLAAVLLLLLDVVAFKLAIGPKLPYGAGSLSKAMLTVEPAALGPFVSGAPQGTFPLTDVKGLAVLNGLYLVMHDGKRLKLKEGTPQQAVQMRDEASALAEALSLPVLESLS